MIEIIVFAWVFALVVIGYAYLKHIINDKNRKDD